MKHKHVFTQMDQTKAVEGSRTISKLFPQDRNSKLGWKAFCTLVWTIALILECINVTLNEHCNHQNNQTTVSLLKTIPKLIPMHSETDIPKKPGPVVAGISRLLKENDYKLDLSGRTLLNLLNIQTYIMYCVIVYMLTITLSSLYIYIYIFIFGYCFLALFTFSMYPSITESILSIRKIINYIFSCIKHYNLERTCRFEDNAHFMC